MEKTTTPETIIKQVERYLETKFKLLKYEGVHRASGIIAEMITDLVVVVLLLLTFLFVSITLGLFAAHFLHSGWKGFGCVALLYFIMSLFAKTLKLSLQNIFIRISISKVFKHK